MKKKIKDSEKLWEESKGLKKNSFTDIQQVQHELSQLKTTIATLTNRINAAKGRISEKEDNQIQNSQLIRNLEANLIKTKKSIQEINNSIKNYRRSGRCGKTIMIAGGVETIV